MYNRPHTARLAVQARSQHKAFSGHDHVPVTIQERMLPSTGTLAAPSRAHSPSTYKCLLPASTMHSGTTRRLPHNQQPLRTSSASAAQAARRPHEQQRTGLQALGRLPAPRPTLLLVLGGLFARQLVVKGRDADGEGLERGDWPLVVHREGVFADLSKL